jgi:hypothetical protein
MEVDAAATEAIESTNAPAFASDRWRNYRVSLTIGSENYDDIGIMFRYQDQDNYYRFSWSNQHTQRGLVKCHNGRLTILAKDILSVVPPNPYQLTIVAEDGALEVWIDTTFPGTFTLYAL